MIQSPSPNFDARRAPPDMAVIHYTGMVSTQAALHRLCDPAAKVSAHYVVDTDGQVFQLVDETRRAWHAGVSYWRGERDVNARAIGFELVNPGHEHGYVDFPTAQIDALVGLLDAVRGRWSVADGDIVGHSDVAPERKVDPGERFPWRRLAQAGHGLWADPPEGPGAPVGEGETGPAVFALQAGLARLGFDCAPSGVYDGRTAMLVQAFQRHWRPERFDGVADGATRARLIALLRLVRAAAI